MGILSSVFSIINPVSFKPTRYLTLYISADRMICRIVIGSCFPGRFPSFFLCFFVAKVFTFDFKPLYGFVCFVDFFL